MPRRSRRSWDSGWVEEEEEEEEEESLEEEEEPAAQGDHRSGLKLRSLRMIEGLRGIHFEDGEQPK